MKFTAFVLLLLTISLYAGAYIAKISASADGDYIKVEWLSGTETNLKNYVIERRPANISTYTELATIEPKGSNSSYTFVDKSPYKTTSGFIFVYSLKMVDNDGQTSRIEVTVSSNVSGVKRTWGQIKAMFR